MRRNVLFVALALQSLSASAQSAPVESGTFRAASTVVTVPTLVRDRSGRFVTDLDAGDFHLFDNGVRQFVKLGNPEHEPIALIVEVQTGSVGARHFLDYANLPLFLNGLTSVREHDRMLVTFDSRVEMIWPFPQRSDGVNHALSHLHEGDSGAALLDAVEFGVQQLQSEPGYFRRIVLVISQETDSGSATPPETVLQTLGKGSTIVYSLTFSASDSKRKRRAVRKSKNSHTGTLLTNALDDLQTHTASHLATYTGGAHLSFTTPREFDEALLAIAADIRNRYVLSFQPSPHLPGLHELRVEAGAGLSVMARGGYWFDPIAPTP